MRTAFSDRWGVPLHAGTPDGVAHFDRSVDDLVRLGGDPVAHAEAAVAADPELVLARLLLAYFALYGATSDGRGRAPREVLAGLEAVAPPLGEREILHLRAVRAWTEGDWVGAARALERALLHDPHDLLALKVAQDLYFFLGRQVEPPGGGRTRCFPPGRRPTVRDGATSRGSSPSGSRRTATTAAAEDHARAALAASADDVWATHALAHVYEMEGDLQAGEAFLSGTAGDLVPQLLRRAQLVAPGPLPPRARTDRHRARAVRRPDPVGPVVRVARHLVDAAALLWRVTLFGVDVTERAVRLADDIEPLLGRSIYLFNDWHAVMALGLAGRHDTVDQVIAEARRSAVGTNRTVVDEVGVSLLEGFASVADGGSERAVDLLVEARPRARAVGGATPSATSSISPWSPPAPGPAAAVWWTNWWRPGSGEAVLGRRHGRPWWPRTPV